MDISNFNLLKKLSLMLVIVLSLAAGIYFSLPFLKAFEVKPQVQPKLIQQTKLSNLVTRPHPAIYSTQLEYDVSTGIITQLAVNLITGDLPVYLPKQPKTLSGDFLYRIEVSDDKDGLTNTGWKTVPVELLQKMGSTIKFNVAIGYQKNGLIKIYLPDGKLIWTGKMS